MIGLIILTFVPAIAAVMFWLRARNEMRARVRLQQELDQLRTPAAEAGSSSETIERRRRLLGVVAHELRSPISAILGYQELLAEGIFGPLDPRAHEATLRIRSSAQQLLHLSDGMYELAHANPDTKPELSPQPLEPIIADAIEFATAEAANRQVTIEADAVGHLPAMSTDATRLRRAIDLALAAASKASPDAVLRIRVATDDDEIRIIVDGSRLDPVRDAVDEANLHGSTGAALRIAMARAGAAPLGGTVTLEPTGETCRVMLRFPREPEGR